MKESEVRSRAFAMPLTSPAYPLGPYRFVDREYLIITYRTDPAEAARARAGAARGRRAAGQVRVHPHAGLDRLRRLHRERAGHPGVASKGRKGGYYPLHVPQRPSADRRRPRALGLSEEARQARRCRPRSTRWSARSTTARCAIATGTMGYKHKQADLAPRSRPRWRRPTSCSRSSRMSTARRASASWSSTTSTDVDAEGRLDRPGRARSCISHALAPVAELPVLEVVSAVHILADLTLGLGKVVHDYLA